MSATSKNQTKMFFNNCNSQAYFIFNSLSINIKVSVTIMTYTGIAKELSFPRKGEILECMNNSDLYYTVETYGSRIESLCILDWLDNIPI